MKVTVKDRQSLLDVAIQVLGSAVGVFALAERNGISITDRLKDGMVLEYDLGDIVDSRTAELVAARDICPATEIPQKDESALIRRVWPWRFRPMRPPILPPLVRPDVITTIGTMYDSGVKTEAAPPALASDGTPEENVLEKTLNKAIQAAAKNDPAPSESGQAVTSIFTNQFNDVFA
jgi:hypothetical protein|nr:MAG TPA: hypothetical protein [Caudoviricetes sp.]